MATLCNRCLQPIQWRQDNHDRWVAMELHGEQEHRLVCRGEPVKGTKDELKTRIVELEKKLATTTETLRAAQMNVRYWEGQYRELLTKQQVFNLVQNILNAGVAWFRARETRSGKTDLKLEVLKEAVIRYCEIEGKGSKKKAS